VAASLSGNYILQNKGDVSANLGVQVTKDNQSKTITLTQPGLIAQLIQDVGMDDYSKGKDTPVDSILYADTNCAPQKDKWNYRSVIGKLNYLATNTGLTSVWPFISVQHFVATPWLFTRWQLNKSSGIYPLQRKRALFFTHQPI
jgi:hypothetical protein